MADYYVYILTNSARTLYVGVTNDLERRVWQHRHGWSESFTRRYHLTMLAYCETYETPGAAIAREKELKGWRRARKIELIEHANPHWLDLAADWFGEGRPTVEALPTPVDFPP